MDNLTGNPASNADNVASNADSSAANPAASCFEPLLTTTDWNGEWMRLQAMRHHADDSAFWDKRAETFHKPCVMTDYIEAFIRFTDVKPGETVMDMGCGTGAITIPLAKDGHNVLACDFSKGMLSVLHDEAAKLKLSNIEEKILSWADDWPEHGVEPKSFDVVTASRSIATDDLRDALEKMSSTAKRRCAITLPTGTSPRTDEGILQEIGIQGYIGRDYLYALMILVDMGYFPELRYIPSTRSDTFDSEQEAFESLAKMVRDACGAYVCQDEVDAALDRLSKWLVNNLVSNPNAGKLNRYDEVEGKLMLRNPRKVTWAHIAWNVDTELR